jgi:hypothetical protein
MLPFLKKKSEAGAAPTVPAWHPNFRNYEKLPDIKVVRTAFFINGAAVFAAIGLLTMFGLKELKLRAVTAQVADWQRQIDRDKKSSEAAIVLFKKFQAEEAKVLEVDAFVKSKPSFADIVIHLSKTLPPNVAFDSLDLREVSMTMRIAIKGSSIAAVQTAQNYINLLKSDPEVADQFEKVEMSSTPTRNPTTGRFAVELNFTLKGAVKK